MRSDSFWVLRATSLVVIKSLAHFERLHLAAAVLAMPEALCVFLFYQLMGIIVVHDVQIVVHDVQIVGLIVQNYGPDCPIVRTYLILDSIRSQYQSIHQCTCA